MDVHPNTVFKNILQNIGEDIHYIIASVSFVLKVVHLQIEEIK